jgi:hypothetical protein
MTLEADTVLWAVRGMHDPRDDGVRADDVARFMSKDATLSEDYSLDDVTVVLESLVAEGTLTYVPTTDVSELDENESSHATLYRIASGSESLRLVVDREVADFDVNWDDWSGLGASAPHEVVSDSTAEGATVAVEVMTAAAADDAPTEPSRSDRELELERERETRIAELDEWRRRAESAEHEVARSQCDADQLLARVRELEQLLERERALNDERSETARRAADALARARDELQRLEPAVTHSRTRPQVARPRETFRGNWLR